MTRMERQKTSVISTKKCYGFYWPLHKVPGSQRPKNKNKVNVNEFLFLIQALTCGRCFGTGLPLPIAFPNECSP